MREAKLRVKIFGNLIFDEKLRSALFASLRSAIFVKIKRQTYWSASPQGLIYTNTKYLLATRNPLFFPIDLAEPIIQFPSRFAQSPKARFFQIGLLFTAFVILEYVPDTFEKSPRRMENESQHDSRASAAECSRLVEFANSSQIFVSIEIMSDTTAAMPLKKSFLNFS